MKAAQQQALQRIIIRKLLAKEAEKQKLEKTSEYTVQVERGKETLLGQLLERKYASAATPPTRNDAEAFVASHPDMFADRRVMFVEQIMAGPNKIPQDDLRPLKTMDQVKAILTANNVQYQENAVVLDTLSANPKLVEGIKTLPPDEIFVIPQNGALLFNHVLLTRQVPLQGDTATAYAMNVLRTQRARELVTQRVSDMRKAAESKIKYNPAYKPPAPAAAPAAKGAAAPPAKK
jgi:EpsD family peptidyl-prolyl cis-trans isomerase